MAMGKINLGRVILGGLLAGLVINASESVLNLLVIAGPMEETLKARNLPPVNNTSIGMMPDGERFAIVALQPRGAGAATLMANWDAALK